MDPTPKDRRFDVVNFMLTGPRKQIKTFSEIFKVIPRSVVAQAMHTNNNRFKRLLKDPWGFTLAEIRNMAALFDYDYDKMYKMIRRELK